MERTALRENWPNIMYWFHWSGKFPFCSLNCHPSLRPTPPGTPPQRAARSWRRWGGWYWGEETHDFSDYPFRGESGDFENWCLWQLYLKGCEKADAFLYEYGYLVGFFCQHLLSTSNFIVNFLFFIGFKLASLNRIIDTKSSSNSKITLLHYLIMVLERKVKSLRISNKWTPTMTVSTRLRCFALQTHIT